MGLGLGSGPVFDIREAFKKKTIFFVTNVTLWGGGLERVHVTKKTIASKSFLSNFKYF